MSATLSYPDAVDLLDADHKLAQKMFLDYQALCDDGAPSEARQKLALKICEDLSVHTQIEEEIFYPAFRQAAGDNELADHAKHEHDEARQLIAQIESQGPQDALVSQLQKSVEHHVKEEREKMFPKARSAGMDLDSLGMQLERRKQELMEQQTV
jgi:iron-sulfur cluster repair protein YtfE (RIC family)